MRFRSTRGGGEVGLRVAVLEGLARDGGLYLPVRVPALDAAVVGGLGGAEPLGLARAMMAPFLDSDLGPDGIERVVERALDLPAPLVALDGATDLLELWRGPTLAFKDFGARFMAEVLDALRARDGDDSPVTVLVATSGDTGGAVAAAFAGRPGIRAVVLFPREGVSAVQRRQLTADLPGVTACEVEGTFDDCQRLAKEAFADRALAERHGLTSANSINVARWLPQATYFGALAIALARRGGAPPEVCVVPSGNLGNVTAGVLADRMGLPVPRLAVATNENDVAARFLAGEGARPRPAKRTLSNAMDVGAPSNLERLRALFGSDAAVRRGVDGVSVGDGATVRAMRSAHARAGLVVCPHTAAGLAGLERLRERAGRRLRGVVLATAHPAKFPEALGAAGLDVAVPDALDPPTRAPLALAPEIGDLRGALESAGR